MGNNIGKEGDSLHHKVVLTNGVYVVERVDVVFKALTAPLCFLLIHGSRSDDSYMTEIGMANIIYKRNDVCLLVSRKSLSRNHKTNKEAYFLHQDTKILVGAKKLSILIIVS